MKYKIGVFGSAVNESDEIMAKTKKLGQILSKENAIIITGACAGLPDIVADEAFKNGSEVWGFAPEVNYEKLQELYPGYNLKKYKKIFYIPENNPELFFLGDVTNKSFQKYRNVISTSNCDAGIIISGRWGSLNEFTNLFDMGKVIGVLTGTGGIADELEALSRKIYKLSSAKVIFDNDPKKLVEEVIEELDKRNS